MLRLINDLWEYPYHPTLNPNICLFPLVIHLLFEQQQIVPGRQLVGSQAWSWVASSAVVSEGLAVQLLLRMGISMT